MFGRMELIAKWYAHSKRWFSTCKKENFFLLRIKLERHFYFLLESGKHCCWRLCVCVHASMRLLRSWRYATISIQNDAKARLTQTQTKATMPRTVCSMKNSSRWCSLFREQCCARWAKKERKKATMDKHRDVDWGRRLKYIDSLRDFDVKNLAKTRWTPSSKNASDYKHLTWHVGCDFAHFYVKFNGILHAAISRWSSNRDYFVSITIMRSRNNALVSISLKLLAMFRINFRELTVHVFERINWIRMRRCIDNLTWAQLMPNAWEYNWIVC